MTKKLVAMLAVLLLSISAIAIAEENSTESASDDAVPDEDTADASDEDSVPDQSGSDASDAEDDTSTEDSGNQPDDAASEDELDVTDEEAEDYIEIDDETAGEAELIQGSKNGATLRILQLKKAVTISIVTAKEIIKILQEKGEDTSGLSSILAEYELILGQTESLDPQSEDAVTDFVALKRDIKDLNTQFRNIASPKLSSNEKNAIRDRVRSSQEIAAVQDEIVAQRNTVNADSVSGLLDRLGITDEELVDRIRSGDATPEEIREALKGIYKSLTPQEKLRAKERIRERVNENKEKLESVKNRVREKIAAKAKERIEERIKNLPEDKQEIAKLRLAKQSAVVKRVNAIRENVKSRIISAAEKNRIAEENRGLAKAAAARRASAANTAQRASAINTATSEDSPTGSQEDGLGDSAAASAAGGQ